MKTFLILHTIIWALIVFVCSFGMMMWSGHFPTGLIDLEFLVMSFIHTFLYSFPLYAIGRLIKAEFKKRFKRI